MLLGGMLFPSIPMASVRDVEHRPSVLILLQNTAASPPVIDFISRHTRHQRRTVMACVYVSVALRARNQIRRPSRAGMSLGRILQAPPVAYFRQDKPAIKDLCWSMRGARQELSRQRLHLPPCQVIGQGNERVLVVSSMADYGGSEGEGGRWI